MQLVLLDHGLYRQLTESTRVNYANFWRALIFQDEQNAIRYATALGIPRDCWSMFAFVVLMRPFRNAGVGMMRAPRLSVADERRVIERNQRKMSKLSNSQQAALRAKFLAMMRNMPRELLLVLRTQNYLRFLDRRLGTNDRFVVMARVSVAVADHVPEEGGDASASLAGLLWRRVKFEAYLMMFSFTYTILVGEFTVASWFRALTIRVNICVAVQELGVAVYRLFDASVDNAFKKADEDLERSMQ